MLGGFSQFARDAQLSLRLGRAELDLRLHHRELHAQLGATRADFGRIAVAQRSNALANPNAMFKVPLTIEQYLDARRSPSRSICSTASCRAPAPRRSW
jgi:acetyl-CoA acetyltransferase